MQSRWVPLLMLVAAIAWAAGLRAAIRWHAHRVRTTVDAPQSENSKRGAELAALLPPAPPPAGHVGRDDVHRLDARSVIALIRTRRTAELDEVLRAAEDEFEDGARSESAVESLFGGLSFTVASDFPALDAWVARSPESFAARAARGAALLAAVRRARLAPGASGCADSPAKDVSRARADLERAIAVRPGFIVAHTLLLRSYADENVEVPRELYDRAVAACVTCAGPRIEYMRGLAPSAGGSRAAMEAFAEESQGLAKENPRLAALRGYGSFDECKRQSERGDYEAALGACDRAVEEYPAAAFLREKAMVLHYQDRRADSAAILTRVLAENPYDAEALIERARQYCALEDWNRAVADLRLAHELEPDDAGALDLLGWIVDRFESDARRATRFAELDAAFDAYDVAARLLPERRDFVEARDALARRTGRRGAESLLR